MTKRVTYKSASGRDIPEMWLVGFTGKRMAKGMHPVAAYQEAIAWWNEQERLEAQFNAERGR